VLTAIVNGNRQPNELGQDGRAARPGFDWSLVVTHNGCVNLFDQVSINEWAFFDRT
jgi:hypothetical protein